MIKNALVSWKTSIMGVIACLLTSGPEIVRYFDETQVDQDWKKILLGFVFLILGIIARDGDKSSEQTGAKPLSLHPAWTPEEEKQFKDAIKEPPK